MRGITIVVTLAAAGTVGAGGDKELGPIARAATEALKADLAAFEVRIYGYPPPGKGFGGSPDDDPTWVRLVTDPKRVAAKPKQAFAITEKQAAGLIDYLAESGMFAQQATDGPGIPFPGWYVAVTGGKPARRLGYWRYESDVKPGSVGVMQYLGKALDGDAKSAVENFRKDTGAPKK